MIVIEGGIELFLETLPSLLNGSKLERLASA
jgi:hypothetical protein